LTATLAITRMTIREAARRRLLLALVVLTLAVVGLTGWGFSRIAVLTGPDGASLPPAEMQLAASQLLVLVAFMFSAVLALSAVIVAAPSISAEVESGIALAVLARPVSRYQVLVGKWLAFAFLIAVYAAATTATELTVVGLTTGYQPPGPVGLAAYLIAEGIVIMSLTLLLSTRLSGMTAGVIGLVLFFLAWLGGVAGTIGDVFNNAAIRNTGTVSQFLLPTDALWRGAAYELEPPVYRALFGLTPVRAGNPFFVDNPPSLLYLTWCAVWVGLVIGGAVVSFRRRDV
jgi:ABC-type transport system involved in multi-copper enzyme maturation permease subunit